MPDETNENPGGEQEASDPQTPDTEPAADAQPDRDAPEPAQPADPAASTEADAPEHTEVETTYEATPTGHRITRRNVRRRVEKTEEDIVGTITEDLPYPQPRPAAAKHPAPVG